RRGGRGDGRGGGSRGRYRGHGDLGERSGAGGGLDPAGDAYQRHGVQPGAEAGVAFGFDRARGFNRRRFDRTSENRSRGSVAGAGGLERPEDRRIVESGRASGGFSGNDFQVHRAGRGRRRGGGICLRTVIMRTRSYQMKLRNLALALALAAPFSVAQDTKKTDD